MIDSMDRRLLLKGAIAAALGAAALPRLGFAAAPAQLTVVNTEGPFTRIFHEVVRSLGYMDQFGVEAKTSYILGTPLLVEALVKGNADLCIYSGFSPVLAAIEKGAPLKILAGANMLPAQAVFAKSPSITRLKDLEGKRIGVGVSGALLHQLMVAALQKGGADPAKVTFVDIGNTTQVFRAIVDGKVDAGPAEAGFLDLQKQNNVHVLTDGKLWETVPAYTNQASYASMAAITSKRPALVATLAAHAKLYRYMQEPQSWDAYAAARKVALKQDNPAEARAQWDFYQTQKPFAVNLVVSEERIRYVQELNVAMGMQSKVMPYEQVADMSLARDALKLIG
ncbi:MAG: ABC transporter substrate-binding protein [Burkholderiales bacterium]